MTRGRAALLMTIVVGSQILTVTKLPAVEAASARHGTVIVFVEEGVSFEELLGIPQFRSVAAAGGAGLMATNGNYRDDGLKVYQALGSGTTPGRRPQLMARTLSRYGIAVCVREGAGLAGYRPPQPGSPLRFLGLGPDGDSACPEGGGANPDEVLFISNHFIRDFAQPGQAEDSAHLRQLRKRALVTEGKVVEGVVGKAPLPDHILLMIVSPTVSPEMKASGDEVTPLLMARGPARLFDRVDAMHALRSETTRQTGLVANVDVAPTILDFFGVPIPPEMDGQPIRVTNEPAPFKLHRLHLEQRRIRLPIQLAEVAFVSAAGFVAILALLIQGRRRGLPTRVAKALRFLALCGAAFPIPLMLGGVLPRLTYWVVLPFVVLSVVSLAALARASRWPGPTGPFVFLGLVGLAVVVVDAMLGWRGARIPLIGGTMFDGARFYGLPNAFLCVVLASALFVAATLPAFTGLLLLVAAGLFAGFPSLGADIGGAMTLFFAAGLWWVLRTRPHLGIRELAFVAGLTALGLGAVLLANRYLPGSPTHATAFVERTGRGLGSAFHEFGARLRIGFGQLGKAPAAWIPLLGLPAVLALILQPLGPIKWGLGLAGQRWRHALIVLTLSGIVAFFANDTGLAAAAPVFLYAMSGMAYPAWLVPSGSGVNGSASPSGDRHE